MAIYTKTGDGGQTGLFGGRRVSKSDPIIVANGELDELTSTLGLARVAMDGGIHCSLVLRVQQDIYVIMGMIAGYESPNHELEARIVVFEQAIDTVTNALDELHAFVIPGDNEPSARLHVARAVCRRAERALVALQTENESTDISVIVRYLNRLSDLLFTLARAAAPTDTKTKK